MSEPWYADEWFDAAVRECADQGMLLGTPHRTFADAEVLLEWWNKDRRLSVSIVGHSVQMLWCWERNGEHFIRDVENASPSQFVLAWTWLNRREPTAGSKETR